jgi:hypothetical protein
MSFWNFSKVRGWNERAQQELSNKQIKMTSKIDVPLVLFPGFYSRAPTTTSNYDVEILCSSS